MGTRTVLIAAISFAPCLAMSAAVSAQRLAEPSAAATATERPMSSPPNAEAPRTAAVRAPVRREVPPKPRRVVKPAVAATAGDAGPADASVAKVPSTESTLVVAQAVAPVAPARKPVPSKSGGSATTATQPSAAPVTTPPAAVAAVWTAEEVQQAKEHCSVVLRGVDAVLATEQPIKEGECGSPVVYKVSGIGKGPSIELSPPVMLTCDMVASLDKWVKREVQPQARALLGGSVVKIDTMSSYSCRTAYGRARAKLSEHGKANAIDIGAFHTGKDVAVVLTGWGPTAREQKALAAKKESERPATPVEVTGSLPRVIGPPSPSKGAVSSGIPGVIISGPGGSRAPSMTGLGLGPNRLGGPKGAEGRGPPIVSLPADADPRQRFLHEIHAAACKHFGTVLGPEANNAHKNHFHLDMAPRKLTNFCE